MTKTFEIQLKNRVMARFSVWKPAFISETTSLTKMIELSKPGAKNCFGKMLLSGDKTIYYAVAGKIMTEPLNIARPVFKIQVKNS